MDVRFKQAISIGRGLDRYIPILMHKMDDISYQLLIEEAEDLSFDLTSIKDDEFWQQFLHYYNLTQYLEGEEGNAIKVYRLKPSVELNFPNVLALVWGASPQNVKFDEVAEETLLTAMPTNGRNKEYIVMQGTLEFNKGGLFMPDWRTISLD